MQDDKESGASYRNEACAAFYCFIAGSLPSVFHKITRVLRLPLDFFGRFFYTVLI